MKKFPAPLIFLSVLLSAVLAFAEPTVYFSSHTATADTTKALCNQTFTSSWPRGLLHTVCVNTGASTSSFTIYNSSASAVNPIAIVDSTTKGCQTYDIQLSSGISYTNSSTADVTISYLCY